MQRYACQNETMKAESCAEGIVKKFKFGVPYGNRTRVTAVKEKRFTGIQRKPAAWIAP
jgi:hypothetical protein